MNYNKKTIRDVDVHQMPVVQPGPLDGPVGDVEAQRADEVQAAAGGGAGAGDVAAVLRYLRLYQYDMQHTRPNSFLRYLLIVMQKKRKCNYKIGKMPYIYQKHEECRPFGEKLGVKKLLPKKTGKILDFL